MAQPFMQPCDRGVIAAETFWHTIVPARRSMVLTACVLASSMAFIDGSVL